MLQDTYVDLERTFFDLPIDYTVKAQSDELDLADVYSMRLRNDATWNELLNERRIIILAPAGAGKTTEILEITKKLRKEKKAAFFLRLEHISTNFASAFEGGDYGDYEDFQKWLSIEDEGWVFLDSIDEARLKSPQDFESAIRTLSLELKSCMQRVHIVITGRVEAWRAKSDLELCNKKFEYRDPEAKSIIPVHDEDSDGEQDFMSVSNKPSKQDAGLFKVFAITNLSERQIERFSRFSKVKKVDEFLNELNRKEAEIYTARPQDLLDLLSFWQKHERIGSYQDLMENSIERKLEERKDSLKAARPISVSRLQSGVKIIAAAATLMNESRIKVPYSVDHSPGIRVDALLNEWPSDDCETILSRPIFDGIIYGAVRFHHRSAREYLTAKWLHDCLVGGLPRSQFENLFIQKKYGVSVIVPAMRGILPWFILFDSKLRKEASTIDPEIVLEGGDPSKLPLKDRKEILIRICKKLSNGEFSKSIWSYSGIDRFANLDMADDIRKLIKRYSGNSEVITFLVRMILQGKIVELLPEVKEFAENPISEKYLRIAAIRAVHNIGTKSDFSDLLTKISLQNENLNRIVTANIVDLLEPTSFSVRWLLDALERTAPGKKFTVDGLRQAIGRFTEKLSLEDLSLFALKASELLSRDPLIEKRHCEVSENFGWLLENAANAVQRLIDLRAPISLEEECLSILVKIPVFHDREYFDRQATIHNLHEQINEWPDLNFALFWKDVRETRRLFFQKPGERLTYWYQAYQLRGFWSFAKEDFLIVEKSINEKITIDDKLVALTLAVKIYNEHDRPPEWKSSLERIVQGNVELEDRLVEALLPISQSAEQKKWKKQEENWKRKDQVRERLRKVKDLKDKAWILENFQNLNDRDLLQKTFSQGHVLNAQYYLVQQMRILGENSDSWTQSNWRDLVVPYNESVANALREGLILSWRLYKPNLKSEIGDEDETPSSVIIGLSGIEIEAKEVDTWPINLTPDEVLLACRYAFHELNGFPVWFPKLHKFSSSAVTGAILAEIDWQIFDYVGEKNVHYVLDKVSWSGQYLWDDLAPAFLSRLEHKNVSAKNLAYMLKVIQGSDVVQDNELALVAEEKCKNYTGIDELAQWFAVWIGVDPRPAIKALQLALNKISGEENKLQFSMQVLVNLTGDRREGANSRGRYKKPEYLASLYLLMGNYIRREEDINRAGTGAYSPGLRDKAQEARERILNILSDIPGEPTYRSLRKLARRHPNIEQRRWIKILAKERAEKDAINPVWLYSNFHKIMMQLKQKDRSVMQAWEKYVAVISALVGLTLIFITMFVIPAPTASQEAILRTILALSAAGFSIVLPGFLHVEGKWSSFSIRACGALAMFVLIYFFLPALTP